METTSPLHHSLITSDIMSSFDQQAPEQRQQAQQYLKLDDLHNTTPATPAPSSLADDGSPPPSLAAVTHSRATKKRKSWGQELPEPTTNLPPRKRAKTDDEKEQRRIERIKRNRAAAQHSRERKRAETETLAIALARANAQLEVYRQIHGPLPAGTRLPEVTLETSDGPVTSSTPTQFAPHRMSFDQSVPPPLPKLVSIKQEPTDTTLIDAFPSPPADNEKSLSPVDSVLDQTQHSAAMLSFDLQCQSSTPSQPALAINLSSRTPSRPWPLQAQAAQARIWSTILLYLTNLCLLTASKTILLALWTISPSRTQRWIAHSTSRLASRSTTSSATQHLCWSMVLAQRNAATASTAVERGALAALRPGRVAKGSGERAGSHRVAEVRRVPKLESDSKACSTDARQGRSDADVFDGRGVRR